LSHPGHALAHSCHYLFIPTRAFSAKKVGLVGIEDKLPQLDQSSRPPEPPLPYLDLFERINSLESRYRNLPATVAHALKRREPAIGLGAVTYLETKDETDYYTGIRRKECVLRIASLAGWDILSWNALQHLAHRYGLTPRDGKRDFNDIVELRTADGTAAAAVHLDGSNSPPRNMLYLSWDYPRRDELFLDLVAQVYCAGLDGSYRPRPRPPAQEKKGGGGLGGFFRRLFGGGE
jgi:hypothetical protein